MICGKIYRLLPEKKGGFQSDIADGDTYVITLIYGDADKFIEKYGKLPKETENEYIIHF